MNCDAFRLIINLLAQRQNKVQTINDEEAEHLTHCRECIGWLFETHGPKPAIVFNNGRILASDPTVECETCRLGFLGLLGRESNFPWYLHIGQCSNCREAFEFAERLLSLVPSIPDEWSVRVSHVTQEAWRLKAEDKRRIRLMNLRKRLPAERSSS